MACPPPPDVAAYELALAGDEFVLFAWDAAPVSAPLTAAQREVLAHVLNGLSNSEIAAVRGTSVRTIANQVAKLLRTLGARSRFELIGKLGGSARPR